MSGSWIHDLSELRRLAGDLNDAARVTGAVDPFCSSFNWIEPAYTAFHADRALAIYRQDAHYTLLCRGQNEALGRYYMPLEAAWGLATPFVGPRLAHRIPALVRPWLERDDWDSLFLTGIPPHSPLEHALLHALKGHTRLGHTQPVRRYVADISDGLDGFYSRRSRKLRRNQRRSRRLAVELGVRFERYVLDEIGSADTFFHHALDVESRSWKGASGHGIDGEPMRSFCQGVLHRSATHAEALGILAWLGETPIGFIYGAVFADGFRGLQMSYDDSHRAIGLGNLLQHEMIAWVVEVGATDYDLGSEVPYKERWAEGGLVTRTLVAFRPNAPPLRQRAVFGQS